MADATQQYPAPGVTGLYSLYRFRELGFSVMGCCPAKSTEITPSFSATKSASGCITRKRRRC